MLSLSLKNNRLYPIDKSNAVVALVCVESELPIIFTYPVKPSPKGAV